MNALRRRGRDNAAPVLGDLGVDQLAAMDLEPREGPFLIGADQPAVARDVGGENGGQPAFDALPSQAALPNRQRKQRLSALS
jgi:hypothetical protein